MKYKSLALAAAALTAGMLSFGSAQAANVMSGAHAPIEITKMQDNNIQTASHRKKWRRHWRRHHGGHGWRGGHRSGIFLGFGLAPFYSPYYAPPRRYYAPARGSRHVRWCLDRYRSYDPRSNTFLGYDGDRHRCRSPYRY